jgi:hypothetical protein
MYAYDFRPRRAGLNHREIFVAMPFAPEFDGIFEVLVKRATEEANRKLGYDENLSLSAYRTKDDIRTTSGWINILEHLFTAQIVLGVLTSDNPNVFYELGIARVSQPLSRQVLIATKGYRPKFNTKDLIYYEYDSADLLSSVEPLATKIEDAIRTYNIEHEKIVHQAAKKIGPREFEVIMKHSAVSHFAIDTSDEGIQHYEEQFGRNAVERHIYGVTNLCQQALLAFNTLSRQDDATGQILIEFSYYWTGLGNDVLHLMKLINQEILAKRRSEMPKFID